VKPEVAILQMQIRYRKAIHATLFHVVRTVICIS